MVTKAAGKTSKAAAKKSLFVPVERPASKRGRKAVEKPNMEALVGSWQDFPIGTTIVLPDGSGDSSHAKVTLDRHHFGKYAKKSGLSAGDDYTIEASEQHGAVITRLR